MYGIQNEAQHKKWTITNAKPCDVTHTTVHSHTRTYIYGCIETCWFIWFRYWTATCQSSITVSGGMSFANALISRFHCYMAHIGKSDYNEYDEFIIHKSGLQTNAKPHEAHCWKVFSFKFTTAVGLCVCVCVRTVHDTDRGTVKLDCLRRDQMKRFQNAQFKRNWMTQNQRVYWFTSNETWRWMTIVEPPIRYFKTVNLLKFMRFLKGCSI